jgi:threonine dehydrogenase-like Zn-dependent dehydrogenase
MNAFVILGPRAAGVRDVPAPAPAAGEVIVDVARGGVCGTDVEFYTGEMAYLHTGRESYPVRIGHEWMGVVSAVGDAVDRAWLGRRVTADTMIGCGTCRRCVAGRHHVCSRLTEIGISRGRAGGLAEQVAVPSAGLRSLPDSVDDAMGAMVEPGGNAFRAVRGAGLVSGERLLVLGAGTIGLLAAMFARAEGVEVHVLGRSARSLDFARSLGFDGVWTSETLPDLPWDAVIDASNAVDLPARAVELVEPGRNVVAIGLAGEPSLVDTRTIALRDVALVGILGGSAGLDGAIAAYATGAVDPRPLIAATVGLDGLVDILAGHRPRGSGDGPKFHASI